jgi:hypothetical protein
LKWHELFCRICQSPHGEIGSNKYSYFMLGFKPLSAVATVITQRGWRQGK